MDASSETLLSRYRRDHQNPVNRRLHAIGIPMIVVSLAVVFFKPSLGLLLFVVGWILQFVGHAFEGKAPSFFSDARFLLVGPIWLGKKILGRDARP